MLPANANTSLAHAGCSDVVDEPRERRDASNEKCSSRAPVAGKPGRIAIDAAEEVHIRDGNVGLTDDEVVADEYGGHWAQEDRVTTKERKECCGRGEDFPLYG